MMNNFKFGLNLFSIKQVTHVTNNLFSVPCSKDKLNMPLIGAGCEQMVLSWWPKSGYSLLDQALPKFKEVNVDTASRLRLWPIKLYNSRKSWSRLRKFPRTSVGSSVESQMGQRFSPAVQQSLQLQFPHHEVAHVGDCGLVKEGVPTSSSLCFF